MKDGCVLLWGAPLVCNGGELDMVLCVKLYIPESEGVHFVL